VDDDEAVREALSEFLEVTGLSTRTYACATAFLADYAPGRFDLLVSDLKMPGMDGIGLLRRLNALGARLPAIIVTSASDPATRARAIDQGALAWLTKPVADDVLLHLIVTVLEGDRKAPRGN
jgi:FixJ family two-component response regulator